MFSELLGTIMLSYSLSAGYIPDFAMQYDNSPVVTQQQFFTDFNFELSILDDTVFFKFGEKALSLGTKSILSYRPETEKYTAGFGLRYKGLEVGVEHYCTHPVANFVGKPLLEMPYYAGANTFYVKLSGKVELFK